MAKLRRDIPRVQCVVCKAYDQWHWEWAEALGRKVKICSVCRPEAGRQDDEDER